MRLHTNVLHESTIYDMVKGWGRNPLPGKADITVGALTVHGSRTHARAFELQLAGNGISGGAYGGLNFTTATWDEYGIILAKLFMIDPNMRVGGAKNPVYEDAGDFHQITCQRYRDLTPEKACLRHRWEWGWGGYACCKKCGAELQKRGW